MHVMHLAEVDCHIAAGIDAILEQNFILYTRNANLCTYNRPLSKAEDAVFDPADEGPRARCGQQHLCGSVFSHAGPLC